MLKTENADVVGWEHAIRGMRNPMNSWEKSDSYWGLWEDESPINPSDEPFFFVGPNDLDLMVRLRKAGADHRKFMRMIAVYVDITAPLYWWPEYDTYKVGTVANSCSRMHKLLSRPFEVSDFSFDRLFEEAARPMVDALNELRDAYLVSDDEAEKKEIWYAIIQLLPESYMQKRTVMLNYEVLTNMYHARKNHKLDEWHDLCRWMEKLPYAKELIVSE